MSQEILARGKIAVVFRTNTCSCLNITLPNLNLHLEPSGFYSFAHIIGQTIEAIGNQRCQKDFFMIPTPYQGIDLHFRKHELLDFQDVLTSAILKMQLEKLSSEIPFNPN